MALVISGRIIPSGISLGRPTPTYALASDMSSVTEGGSVTFVLTTTNVSDGTVIGYTLTGVTAGDIQGGQLTGNFTINLNTGSVVIVTLADEIPEGTESMTMTLAGNLATETVSIVNEPQDPYFSSVSLLLHGEGTNGSTVIVDSSSNHFSNSINGSAAISTAQYRYGSASFGLAGGTTGSGSSRAEYSSNAKFSLIESSNFTLEASVFLTGDSIRSVANGVNGNRVANIANSNIGTVLPTSAWWWIISGNATTTGIGMQYATWDSASTQRRLQWDFSTLNKNQWYDLAISRNGGTFLGFLNGTAISPSVNTLTTTTQTGVTPNLKIGSTSWQNVAGPNNFSAALYGYIDELRITKGVTRYTGNYTPTGPFLNT